MFAVVILVGGCHWGDKRPRQIRSVMTMRFVAMAGTRVRPLIRMRRVTNVPVFSTNRVGDESAMGRDVPLRNHEDPHDHSREESDLPTGE